MAHSRTAAVSLFATLVFLIATCSLPLQGQQATATNTSVVPTVVQFSGVLTNSNGKAPSGIMGVTFSLYAEQEGGPPLWMETQNVQPDKSGHYTVMLGSTKPGGLPMELFTSGEARWLGVQPAGEAEQSRVLLLAVPYALKAADAETLGGKPASAFMLNSNNVKNTADTTIGSSLGSVNKSPSATASNSVSPAITGTGSTNFLARWTSSTNLGTSAFFQSGTGASAKIGLGTTTPGAPLDVNGIINSSAGFNLGGQQFAFGSHASGNAFLGFAGNTTMTGGANTGSGYLALYSNTTGNSNVAVGYGALLSNTTGGGNTGGGGQALYLNTTGNYNTAYGFLALQHNTANDNSGSGAYALFSNTSGTGNTASGRTALYANTTGGFNTADGYQALASNVTGCCNTASGAGALYSNTTGLNNAAGGADALYSNSTGCCNTANGADSLYSNTIGSYNTASGGTALSKNLNGNYNTASGNQALYSNISGSNNTANGFGALFSNSASDNTASGYQALYSNTTGNYNTANGDTALRQNTNGSDNTASGYHALYLNGGGHDNTANGAGALYSNTSGYYNTAVGVNALSTNITGFSNTAIGTFADVSSVDLTNATAIGYGAQVNASNTIVLGNAAVTTVETAGSVSTTGDVVAQGNILAAYRVIAGHGFSGTCMTPFLGSVFNPVVCNQFDVAETFASGEATEPGDVLVFTSQPAAAPTARRSSRPYDNLLLGVVSTSPGLVFDNGETHMAGDNSKLITPNKTVVGLAGRVPVKVSMENGPIHVGDPLTSSSVAGVAMKATRAGKILGYALESARTDGKVLLFVEPGYYAVPDLQRLHAENTTLGTKIRQLSEDNSKLRATLRRIQAENIQSRRQLQELLRQVKAISRKLDTTSTVAQSLR
jgi:hypothetical protein